MPNHPPYKTLGASDFIKKYSSFVPKTEIGSPRYNNLVESAVNMQKLRKFNYKVDNAGRITPSFGQKRSSTNAMMKIINK